MGQHDNFFELPHPVRAELYRRTRSNQDLDDSGKAVFSEKGWDVLKPLLRDHTVAMETVLAAGQAVSAFDRLGQVMERLGAAKDSQEGGLLNFTLLTYRWGVAPGALFTITDVLNEMLENSDIGIDIPATFFRSPYPLVYLKFGEHTSSKYAISHPESGTHILEGAYISESSVDGYRAMIIYLIGSPVGKPNYWDDAYRTLGLKLDDSGTVQEAIDEAITRWKRRFAENACVVPYSSSVLEEYCAAIEHLAKVFLYLNSQDAIKVSRPERTELLRKLRNKESPAKRRKLENKLLRAYDEVLVGPKVLPSSAQAQNPSTDTAPLESRKPHWRRGHFRNQPHGPNHSLRKIVFISPVVIGGSLAGARVRDYRIR